jgi:membrane dipeptidase
MTAPVSVVDAHNDLVLELAHRKHEDDPFREHWLPKLQAGGVRLQVCPVAVDPRRYPWALHRGLELCAALHRGVSQNPAAVRLIETSEDVDALHQTDQIGLMLSIEGAELLDHSPELIEIYWRLGVRMIGLTWNWSNAFAAGVGERPELGLTELGRDLVRRAGALGMMLDLAHASAGTVAQALALDYPGRILVSHAGCRALQDSPRNLDDDQLAALAQAGGVLGVAALPFMIDPADPTLERFVDHIDHAVEIMGVERVGIGSDFVRQMVRAGAIDLGSGSGSLRPQTLPPDGAIAELEGPEHFGNVPPVLERRGYGRSEVEAIMGGNLLRLLRDGLPTT